MKQILENVGFTDISITRKENSEEIIKSWNFAGGTERIVFSAYIKAIKPLR